MRDRLARYRRLQIRGGRRPLHRDARLAERRKVLSIGDVITEVVAHVLMLTDPIRSDPAACASLCRWSRSATLEHHGTLIPRMNRTEEQVFQRCIDPRGRFPRNGTDYYAHARGLRGYPDPRPHAPPSNFDTPHEFPVQAGGYGSSGGCPTIPCSPFAPTVG